MDADGDSAPFALDPATYRLNAVPFSEGWSIGVGGVPLGIRFTVQQ